MRDTLGRTCPIIVPRISWDHVRMCTSHDKRMSLCLVRHNSMTLSGTPHWHCYRITLAPLYTFELDGLL